MTAARTRQELVDATRGAIAEIRGLIVKGPHPDHLADYWDYFVRPLQSAPAFVVVQYRTFADHIGRLLEDAGAAPGQFCTSAEWHGEISAASAATVQLLLQAHAEGLGGCWMSGPLLARARLSEVLRVQAPWRILAAVALGWPAESPEPRPRKPLEQVVEWFEE